MNKELLQQISNYLSFFYVECMLEDNKIYSIQTNEHNTPYFELNINSEYNIVYSINLSKNRVFVQNIPIRRNEDYSMLFTLLKIDLEEIIDLIKEDLYARE